MWHKPIAILLSGATLVAVAAPNDSLAQQKPLPLPPQSTFPPPLEGRVDNSYANFAYSSFFRIQPQGWPKIVNQLCNDDAQNLVVYWEKAEIYRTLGNALTGHECHENPRTFPDYYIEYDAPIRYTQAHREQPAELYSFRLPETVDAITRAAPLVSELRTYYTDGNGVRKPVEVTFQSFVEDGNIIYRLSRSPADALISLGSIVESLDEEDLKLISTQVGRRGGSLEIAKLADFVLRRQRIDVPEAFYQAALVLHPSSMNDVMELALPATSVRFGTGMISAFDEENELLATGQYLFLVPQG